MNYIDIHTHSDSISENTISIRSFRFGVEEIPVDTKYISAAIHPWDAKVAYSQLANLEGCLDRFMLISEIGLDSLHDDYALQLELFERQLTMAEANLKAVVIHTVRSHQDTLKTIVRYRGVTKIIHSFIGSWQIAQEYLNQGCYLSFSPLSLRSPKSVDALFRTPLDRLFFETDDSAVSIESVYSRAVEILGVDIKELKSSILNSYNRVCLIHAQSY